MVAVAYVSSGMLAVTSGAWMPLRWQISMVVGGGEDAGRLARAVGERDGVEGEGEGGELVGGCVRDEDRDGGGLRVDGGGVVRRDRAGTTGEEAGGKGEASGKS